jgi:serine/threonine-protein kinase
MSTWTVPSYGDEWAVPGYTQERELGHGASGKVVQAVNDASGHRVAIKYLSPSLVRDPAFMWGFRSEAQMLRELGVPQVVQVYDYVEQPDTGAAIVMELVNGVSLHEMIERRGPTTPEAALTVLKGSLLGLAAAHTLGIVHRDYKPENVLVDTTGNSKLADFGVAVRWGKAAPAAGTPLYMAPEQWHGAPASPATDVYAATAVFFECLTGKTPFSGKLLQLQEQHVTAPVPLDRIDSPLQGLIARGMAKNPAGRPQSAIAFVSELEALAAATYGPDWEEQGRSHLAERVAALLPLLLRDDHPGASGRSYASTWEGGIRRRRLVTVATVAAVAIIAAAAVVTTVTLRGHDSQASLSGNQGITAGDSTSFEAVTNVTPPVVASTCVKPSSFTYSATLSSTGQGTIKYQWVYSTGKTGPVQTASFGSAGKQVVNGDTVKASKASTGWGEVKEISPKAQVLDKATYQLICGKNDGQLGANAWIPVPPTNMTCGQPVPTFTAAGSIWDTKPGKVTYYWALSDGTKSPPQTLTFKKKGTLNVSPVNITPTGVPGSGSAVLVVSSPVAAASDPATYTLSCAQPKLALTASVNVNPTTSALTSCTAAVPTLTFTGTISDNLPGTVSYYWKLPSGNGPVQTVSFTAAGSKAVSTTYKPASTSATGSGSIVITSPGSATSNAAAFTVACSAALTVTNSAPATATTGAAYSGTVTATGGKGTYTWAAVTGLPAGLTAKASGATLTISGTPTAAGTFAIPVSVHDSSTPQGTGTATVNITVSSPTMTVTSSAPATATVGTAYSGTVTVTGGNGTYTWAAVTGQPARLTAKASGATLTISGTPTAVGAATATVSVSDTETAKKTATATVTITVSAPTLTISTGSLPGGQVGVAYSGSVTATGGSGTITYSASGLPAGLSMSSGGAISGKPTAAGSFSVTVTATAGTSVSKAFTVTIAPAVVATSPSPSATPTPTRTVIASPTPTPTILLTATATPTPAPTNTIVIE